MGVKAILSSEQFEELTDDNIKDLYRQNDGKYVLDVEGIDNHPKVATLKTAHERSKRSVKALRDAAHGREVDETAIDDDQTKAALEKMRSRYSFLPEDFDQDAFDALQEAAKGKGGQPTEEQLAQMREKLTEKLEKKYADRHAAEIEPLKAEGEELKGAINRYIVDGGLAAAMDAADIDPKHKGVLLPYLKTRGKIRVERDDDGNRTAVVETDMGNVALKEWVSEFAGTDEGKQYVAKPTGPDPRGNNGGRASGKTISRAKFDAMGQSERAKAIKDGMKVVDQA
ncbi:hypothetical protein [Rhodobium gokarnense]|uniref:Phage protein n=1 Tax=Rhodobium gokarnense TaxID=364296 RepID=A0ABT3HH37_9HYPH|nr:hypothetical protein [Rhodobium gokarnense]MCW2309715.1 hypothetical protein [Rhodobium gokarnense]